MRAPCRSCRATKVRVLRGTGPHFAKVVCAGCGVWIKWLPWSADVVFDPEPDRPVQGSLFGSGNGGGEETIPHSRTGPKP